MIAITLSIALLLCVEPDAGGWREHPEFLRGSDAFAAEQWDEAARAFAAAYADHPRRELLWAHAQALRLGGRCEEALPLYERFVASGPTTDEADDARTNIEACRDVVGESAVVEPVAAEPKPEPALEERAAPPPRPRPRQQAIDRDVVLDTPRPAARDPWGHGLLWSGVGVAAIGAGLLAAGHARRDLAGTARTELGYQRTFAGAPALGQAGIAVLVTGATLITSGLVRFAVVGARVRRSRNSNAVAARD